MNANEDYIKKSDVKEYFEAIIEEYRQINTFTTDFAAKTLKKAYEDIMSIPCIDSN